MAAKGPDKFTPVADSSNSVLLPGVQMDPTAGMQVIPPDLKPIMGSGELTATLLPLADPLPPQPMPLPPEVAGVALPTDALVQGIPQLDMQDPAPPEFPELPPSPAAATPGAEPLAEPLPTSVNPVQRPWPPMLEPIQAPPLPPPGVYQGEAVPEFQPTRLPSPEAVLPAPGRLDDVLGPADVTFAPVDGAMGPADVVAGGVAFEEPAALEVLAPSEVDVEAFPVVAFTEPEGVPQPAQAEPLTGSLTSGWDELAKALTDLKDHDERVARFGEERGRLRAPIPNVADGKVIWESVFGGG